MIKISISCCLLIINAGNAISQTVRKFINVYIKTPDARYLRPELNKSTFKPAWNSTNLNTQHTRQEYECDTYIPLQKKNAFKDDGRTCYKKIRKQPLIKLTMNTAAMNWPYLEIKNKSIFSNYYTVYNSTYTPFIIVVYNLVLQLWVPTFCLLQIVFFFTSNLCDFVGDKLFSPLQTHFPQTQADHYSIAISIPMKNVLPTYIFWFH